MREIKFRTWDNDKKRMLTSDWLNNIFLAVQKCLGFPSHLCAKTGLYLPFSTDINMQYTGLNDKNGVEIYEADIVEILLMKNKHIGKIMYNNKMACFEVYVKHTDGHINSYIIGHIHSIKVIGNIYENPELLQN